MIGKSDLLETSFGLAGDNASETVVDIHPSVPVTANTHVTLDESTARLLSSRVDRPVVPTEPNCAARGVARAPSRRVTSRACVEHAGPVSSLSASHGH